jgi:aspartyl protease family protein
LSRVLCLFLLYLVAAYVRVGYGVEDVHVVALFKDRVAVMIDGKRRLLGKGETSPEGVTLVSADSNGAVFRYQGQTLQRQLDGRVRAAKPTAATGSEVQVFRDLQGMFRTVGSINGLPVSFLVDTGASSIAMNANQARRLGIDHLVVGDPTYVATASNVEQAYRLKLDVVKVGNITLRNVDAVVMQGAQPSEVLLGMSFLNRLELVNQGDKLIRRRKY